MSNFNADAFLNTEIEGQGETEYTPMPEGEYQGVLKELRSGTTEKGSAFMEVFWIIDDQSVRELLSNDEPTCRQTVWLDLNDDGSLAFGINKNIQLNRLREALGQNTGDAWKPNDMLGQVATVDVQHRQTDRGPFAEVKNVRS